MVGMSPTCGLPLHPWALARAMVIGPVVPQQSRSGQNQSMHRQRTFFLTSLYSSNS